MKIRYCKICGNENPPTRYFNCLSCQPALESEEQFTYPESCEYGLNIKTEKKVIDKSKFNPRMKKRINETIT